MCFAAGDHAGGPVCGGAISDGTGLGAGRQQQCVAKQFCSSINYTTLIWVAKLLMLSHIFFHEFIAL